MKFENFSHTTGRSLPDVEDCHVFEWCNFAQLQPHTSIFEGKRNLRFVNCNLLNCDVPEDAELVDCLHTHLDMCAHVHPEFTSLSCKPECRHCVSKEEIYIDGVLVDTLYTYEDKGA